MTIYLCYFDYGGWDNCSHPVQFFLDKEDADDWVNQNHGVYLTMVLGRGYLPR